MRKGQSIEGKNKELNDEVLSLKKEKERLNERILSLETELDSKNDIIQAMTFQSLLSKVYSDQLKKLTKEMG